jgi:hypothetical protein
MLVANPPPTGGKEEHTMTAVNTDSMSKAELQAEIARLKTAAAAKPRDIYLKVSEKGAVSLYGIRRFPITFYCDEWDILLNDQREHIVEFMDENSALLKRKTPKNGK